MSALAPIAAQELTTALLARLEETPDRRDMSFSADGQRAAWVLDGTGLLVLDGPGGRERIDTGLALPPGTQIEIVAGDLLGLCQPADSGVDLVALRRSGGNFPGGTSPEFPGGTGASPEFTVLPIATLGAPFSRLLPRTAGSAHQLLAVGGVEGASALWRIDWAGREAAFVLRVPGRAGAGVWIEPERILALNLLDGHGKSSVHLVDLTDGTTELLFSVTDATDDRVCAYDPARRRLVFSTDAPGGPAIATAVLGDRRSLRLLPRFTPEGLEVGAPWALTAAGALVTQVRSGACSGLGLVDLDSGDIEPLPVPAGEVGEPVVVVRHAFGESVRFPFSSPECRYGTARVDFPTGRFRLDHPEAPPIPTPVHRLLLDGPAGSMEAICHGPSPDVADVVVVALHGGPFDRWSLEWHPDFALLAGLGVAVVALNYPGSTGYGEDFRRAIVGRGGELDVDAVVGVVETLVQRAPAARLVLYGESYGAFLALAAAARLADRGQPVDGVVAFASFASYRGLAESGGDEVRRTLQLLSSGNFRTSGRNPLEGCRNNLGKVLIAHGTQDRTIPLGEARAIVRALRAGGGTRDEDVRIVEFEGQGHGLTGEPALRRWRQELAAFVSGLRHQSRGPGCARESLPPRVHTNK